MQHYWLIICLMHCAIAAVIDESVQCDPQMMHVFFEFDQPFRGAIYAEGHHGNPRCRIYGEGARRVSLSLHLNTDPTREPYCGVKLESDESFSVGVLVNDARDIVVQGMHAYTVRCKYMMKDVTVKLPTNGGLRISSFNDALASRGRKTIAGAGGGIMPVLEMAIREGWGINGRLASSADIGEKITLDIHLADTVPYDFVVFNCIAHDGTRAADATVTLVDERGCASNIARVIEQPLVIERDARGVKHVSLHMRGFQFSSGDTVNFECQVRPCISKCDVAQCGSSKVRRSVQQRFSPVLLHTQLYIRTNESDSSYDRRPVNGPRLWDEAPDIMTHVDASNRTQDSSDLLQRSRNNALATVDTQQWRSITQAPPVRTYASGTSTTTLATSPATVGFNVVRFRSATRFEYGTANSSVVPQKQYTVETPVVLKHEELSAAMTSASSTGLLAASLTTAALLCAIVIGAAFYYRHKRQQTNTCSQDSNSA